MSGLKEALLWDNMVDLGLIYTKSAAHLTADEMSCLAWALQNAKARIKLAQEVESGERVACRFAALSSASGFSIAGHSDDSEESTMEELEADFLPNPRAGTFGTVYLRKPATEDVEGELDD